MSSDWKARRVLVTGATGLVGSWLVPDLLDRGARVVAFARDWDPQSELIRSRAVDRCTVVNGRLEDYDAVERALNEHEIDTVFHLAAQAIVGSALRSPRQTFESNIRGTWNVLDACRLLRVPRLVVASSDKAYGDSDKLPYVESMPPLGRHPYDVSKSCADLLAHSYHHTYGLPVVVARCGNIYGGGDLNWSRIVPGTIRSLLRGERPVVRSDGTLTRDYVYVGDAVDAYRLMAEKLDDARVAGQAFNFGPNRPLSVLDVVRAITRLMKKPSLKPVVEGRALKEIHDQYLSSDKARKVLGWSPAWTLDRGLKATIDWYRRFLAT
jgi:CDP-glucose 4,6-dehydratase